MAIFEPRVREFPIRDLSVTELLFEGLDRDPSATVLIDGATGAETTAAELRSRIERLAGGLTAEGLAPGRVVGILAPNVPDYVTVFHAVAYAGGTVTTINPTYTVPEIAYQLEDAGADILVTVPALLPLAREAVAATGTSTLLVIGEAEGVPSIEDFMGEPLAAQVPVDLDDFTVVLPYSSGTTGKPKGVMLTHRNLVANIEQIRPVQALKPGDCSIAFLPFFHIYGLLVLMNLFPCEGCRIVTMPRFDLEQFLTLAQDHRATHLYIVPPVALALAKHPMVDRFDLSSLVNVMSAAAPLGADLEAAVEARLGARACQGYGMTELSPVSHCTGPDGARHGASGRAVPGTFCRIVDPDSGRDLPAGSEGELWVRGPQVMKGYLNNPDATAACVSEDGWLRTGDLAVIDEDGFLFIRDRLKELIKYKGFQVAPAEVEAALNGHPSVADAAVIGQPDDEAGEVPVAFVVAAPGAEIDETALRAHVDTCLAHYKQPVDYHVVEAIPKSASGKILRRLLRDELAAVPAE
ncbi:AMP-binding protein [Rhodobacterales bacterium HKCCE2091]|nr:AMP-binding protein [Rhodobacterales bacterium HKCCE2091]